MLQKLEVAVKWRAAGIREMIDPKLRNYTKSDSVKKG